MLKHGFELVEERKMPEVDGTARFWRHRKTGAQLLSVCNGDENKCFGVSFCTPPTDSRALPTYSNIPCFCGSKKKYRKRAFRGASQGFFANLSQCLHLSGRRHAIPWPAQTCGIFTT